MGERMDRRVRRMATNLGGRCFASYVWWKLEARVRRPDLIRLHPSRVEHHLYARRGTSDLDVFGMVFSAGEYEPVSDQSDVRFILDGGGNVGYSAAWFLATFPDAVVCSIEPDADNVQLLRRNLEPYGPRAIVLHAALWSTNTDVTVVGGYRDGRSWSRQVHPLGGVGAAGAAVPAVTIDEVMRMVGVERISILKLDVEGAEAELFRNPHTWIDAVDAIAVELHDDAGFGDATAAFRAAIAPLDMDVRTSGELVIACRRAPHALLG
jgi:FkbM family methyltransferase